MLCFRRVIWSVITLIIFNFFVLSNVIAASGVDNYFATDNSYLGYLNIGAYGLNSDSKSQSAADATLFSPIWQNNTSLAFLQARYYSQSNNQQNYNIGGGFRALRGNNLYGLALSYGQLTSEDNKTFNQFDLNGNFWHKNWLFNANVYLPSGEQVKTDDNEAKTMLVDGSSGYKNIGYETGYEQAMNGGDVLLGNNIWRGLTLSAGGYFLKGDGVDDLTGSEAKINYTWYAPPQHKIFGMFDRINTFATIENDKLRKNSTTFGLSFNILLPGQHSDLQGLQKHMTDLLISRDMFTQRYRSSEQLLKKDNGDLVNVAVVNDKAGFEKALADNNADVVAVNGKITGIDDALIDHSVVLTGKDYDFNMGGESFILAVANNGELSAASGKNLLKIAPINSAANAQTSAQNDDRVITIRDLGLEVDPNSGSLLVHSDGAFNVQSGISIFTPAEGSIGTINVVNDIGNGRIALGAAGAGNTASISIENGDFNTGTYNNAGSQTSGIINVSAYDKAYVTDNLSGSMMLNADTGTNINGIINATGGASSLGNITTLKVFNSLDNAKLLVSNDGVLNFANGENSTIDELSSMRNTLFQTGRDGIYNFTTKVGAETKISGFMSNNEFKVTQDGILNQAGDGTGQALASEINFSAKLEANDFFGNIGIYNYANGSKVNFNGEIFNNDFYSTVGIKNYARALGTVVLGDVTSNRFDTQADAIENEADGLGDITIASINYNTIESQNEYGVDSSVSTGGDITINQLIGNTFNTQKSGVRAKAEGGITGGGITLSKVYGNNFTTVTGTDFMFESEGAPIRVNTSDPEGRGLSAANNGATIDIKDAGGDVVITPSE